MIAVAIDVMDWWTSLQHKKKPDPDQCYLFDNES